MEYMDNLHEMIRVGLKQGYITVAQLEDTKQDCQHHYEIGAIHGALAALAMFGIYAVLEPPARQSLEEQGNMVILSDTAQVDVQLPARYWLELHDLADREGLDFAAATICNELAHIERKIAELLAGVQLPDSNADNDNGHEPDSTLKSFIPAPAHAEGS